MPSGFLGRGIGPSAFGVGRLAADWWLAANTIALANVLEHVESPTAGQAYAGAAATGAWSISFRTNLVSLPETDRYVFDSETGRVVVGYNILPFNGFYAGATAANIALFVTGDHSYMVISDGASIQAYRDNTPVGAAVAEATNIGGTARWRSIWSSAAGANWAVAVRAGHVANVALDATQRAALHTAMMALA